MSIFNNFEFLRSMVDGDAILRDTERKIINGNVTIRDTACKIIDGNTMINNTESD